MGVFALSLADSTSHLYLLLDSLTIYVVCTFIDVSPIIINKNFLSLKVIALIPVKTVV